MATAATLSEPDIQLRLLQTPVGLPGSGAVRYAAAMYFHTAGQMPVGMLEIYRSCLRLDAEDPVDLARFEGVAIPPVALQTRTPPA